MSKTLNFGFALLLTVLSTAPGLRAQQWLPIGPDGGDVRSLTYDPQKPDRIVLGTSAGQLFFSNDGGSTWSRYVHLGSGNHYVLDHVVIDPVEPKTMYVAGWSVETTGGDLFRSFDQGATWQAIPALHGKSIRALAMAASDRKTLVIGALDGVFRSHDGGDTWSRISPQNHAEIKNIESVAIDPRNPEVIYAGTWHLPWKTANGGLSWQSIKKGVVDDSDVFSIIVDHHDSSVVYISACSGIYKSENGGELFHKIQGIPFSARRTRMLHQDPLNPAIVYAGTTEGLWKTVDAGRTWKHTTESNIIINDVLVDPRNPQRMLLATDRSGVLASNDGGQSFLASSRGFTHRQVAAVTVDREHPSTIYAGLINDKEYGGVFVSRDDGQHWKQVSAGLSGRDVFSLRRTENGELLAGTNRGVFSLDANELHWAPLNTVVREQMPPAVPRGASKKKAVTAKAMLVRSELSTRVAQIDIAGGKWFAATAAGIFISSDQGRSWRGGQVLGHQDFIALRATPQMVVAATRKKLVVSLDNGSHWYAAKLPAFITGISDVAIGPESRLWIATREGGFRSSDGGDAWEHVLSGLPPTNLGIILYDEEGRRLLASSASAGEVFESVDGGRMWRLAGGAGWPIRMLAAGRGRLLATTAFDGVVAQPESERAGRMSAAKESNASQ